MNKIQQLAQSNKKNIILECFEKENTFSTKQNLKKVAEDDILTYYQWEYVRQKELEH